MRRVGWSLKAGREFDDWIADMSAHAGETMAERAHADVNSRVGCLDRRALVYRASRLWLGLHEMSLQPWHKLAVYLVTEDSVEILGFYDQRQDLSAVDPFSK